MCFSYPEYLNFFLLPICFILVFLNFRTNGIWGWMILCENFLVYKRIFSKMHNLPSVDDIGSSLSNYHNQKISRNCQIYPHRKKKKISPLLRTTPLYINCHFLKLFVCALTPIFVSLNGFLNISLTFGL